MQPGDDRTASAGRTWNDRQRIAVHRALAPRERLLLTIEVSRAALRFAHGRRCLDRELDELHGPD